MPDLVGRGTLQVMTLNLEQVEVEVVMYIGNGKEILLSHRSGMVVLDTKECQFTNKGNQCNKPATTGI